MVATRYDVADVWAEYARTRSEALRNRLMEHYLPLVRKLAQRIHVKLPREVELDDLISAGTFGLMYAVASFDPGRCVKFETYCARRIRGAILDELRAMDWVPRLARVRAQKLLEASRALRLELGREPSDEELCSHLNVAPDELDKIMRDGNVVRVMPFSRRRSSVENEEDQDTEFLEDRRASQREKDLEREDIKSIITRGLSRAEQLIIILYYFEQMTMKEIGATLDLSESRVSQMHSAILMRLQGQLAHRQRELEALTAA